MTAVTQEAPVALQNEITVCLLEEIPVGMGRAFEVAGRAIAIFRTREGRVFAVDNVCPHRSAPLADGIIVGQRVVCPFHANRFDLASGECDQAGTCGINAYKTQVREGWILLTL